jgi:hypothetical protein
MEKRLSKKESLSDVTSKLFDIISKMSHDDRLELYEDLRMKYLQKTVKSSNDRKHTRRKCFSSVECAVDQRLHRGYIKNISSYGLFIEMDVSEKIKPGAKITLTFSHSDSIGHIKTYGKVVRVENGGIGVHLSDRIPLFG